MAIEFVKEYPFKCFGKSSVFVVFKYLAK